MTATGNRVTALRSNPMDRQRIGERRLRGKFRHRIDRRAMTDSASKRTFD
jgi:hypothetical protein